MDLYEIKQLMESLANEGVTNFAVTDELYERISGRNPSELLPGCRDVTKGDEFECYFGDGRILKQSDLQQLRRSADKNAVSRTFDPLSFLQTSNH